MPGLVIENLPPDLHQRLKRRAAAARRSMAAEVLCILGEALGDRPGPPTLEEVDRLRIRGRRPLTQDLLEESQETGRP